VPFRSGSEKGKKPLGRNRRYKVLQIEKIDETGAVCLVMCNSDVVTFFPNGEVHVSLCKWDTIGTRQFIQATSPYDVEHIRGVTYLKTENGAFAFSDAESPLILKDHKVLNPTQQIAYHIDRKAFVRAQESYRGFMEYVKNMGTVLTGINESELRDAAMPIMTDSWTKTQQFIRILLPTQRSVYYHGRSRPRESIAEFLEATRKATEADNLHDYHKLFLQLGVSSLYYNSYLHAYITRWGAKDEPIGSVMLEFFKEMIKHHHREEVFAKKEVPIGEKCSNVNHKYFN
jgi:hypothetical protein